MKTDYVDIKRKLCILRRLLRSPADKHQLADYVEMEVVANAYDGMQSAAGNSRFENDLKGLREWGCEIEHYDKEYHLESYGDFSPVGLGEDELNTLAFLQEAFATGAPKAQEVQQLIAKVADWLPSEQAESLPLRQKRFRLNFRQHDQADLDVRVEEAIQKALKEGRLLRFGYRSPSREDRGTVIHVVQPWALFFDTARGHQYLDAYWLTSDGPQGKEKKNIWQPFRPDRMVGDLMEVLPNKRPPEAPKRARYPLEYLLSPHIARYGHVTRHFEAMQVHETNADGWVRVTGTTGDLFTAVRQLLTYGDQCLVLGGTEARKQMEGLVRGMGELYGKES